MNGFSALLDSLLLNLCSSCMKSIMSALSKYYHEPSSKFSQLLDVLPWKKLPAKDRNAMSGCLSLFAGWLPRGFPHEASSERVSCETATPPHDGLPPPPYEASSLPKGFSSRENLPSGIKEFYNPSNSTIEYEFSYITLKKAHTKFAI